MHQHFGDAVDEISRAVIKCNQKCIFEKTTTIKDGYKDETKRN